MILEFFQWIGQKVTEFVHLFVYSAKAYWEAESARSSLETAITGREREIAELKEQLATREAEISGLNGALDRKHAELEESQKTVKLLKDQIDRFGEYKRVDAEYLRGVQKQLSEEFKLHPVFGFPRSPGLPGSVSIVSSRSATSPDDPGYTITRGRVILDDRTTAQINDTPHIYEKIGCVLNFMRRYGSMPKIIEDLISNGAMSMTLAYREDTTTYEMYYEVTGKNYATDAILVLDDGSGCAVKKEKEDGEG